jgi:hypothetical protein
MKSNLKKKQHWSAKEDQAIMNLVSKQGEKTWKDIAAELNKETKQPDLRSGKQCKERYHNHLNPTINKRPISEEEEDIIFSQH